jgi:sulfate transport system ATP-binding protein
LRSNLSSNGDTETKSQPRAGTDARTDDSLVVSGLFKRFGSVEALKNVGLNAPRGTFMALLGPSGSGKTTLLRILGGLEHADAGNVVFDNLDWLHVPARDRRAGFVFQHYALFKHMKVGDNVAYGLRVRARRDRPSRANIQRRVAELLSLVQLDGFANRYPSQLSGGQRQRVALARALAIEPRMLLLDEPFGALDAKVRKELRRWLRALHDRLGVTTVFVTHDQEEALDLADQVVVMDHGQIEQVGTPEEIYSQPQTAFVAEFLGGSNRIKGRVTGGRFVVDGVSLPMRASVPEGEAVAFVRAHELALAGDGEAALPATVTNVLPAGAMVRLDCRRINGESLEVALPPGAWVPERGNTVRLRPLTERIFAGA